MRKPNAAETLVALMVGAGMALRLINLGHLNFWGDESITALAVQGILEHGYPQFPSGMIYFRGLPTLYLCALSALIWGVNEWALRLPSVLFSSGTIVLVYLLGKRLFSTEAGLLAAFVLTFSYWDFEFARHARMYSGFAFVFLLTLYAMYRGVVEGERFWYRASLVCAALAIFFHELGLTLALVYFALGIRAGWPQLTRLRLFGAALALMALAGLHFSLVQYGFAIPGKLHGQQEVLYPTNLISSFLDKFYGLLPRQVFVDLWPMALLLLLLVILARTRHIEAKVIFSGSWLLPLAAFLAAYGQHLTLALLLIAIYLFFTGKGLHGLREPEVKLALTLIAFMFGFWMIHDWRLGLAGGITGAAAERLRALLKLQLGLPKLYFLGFLYTFPKMSLLVLAGLLWLFHSHRTSPGTATAYFVWLAFVVPMLATGYIKTNWVEYRLNFHLNPLFVLIHASVFLGMFTHLRGIWNSAARWQVALTGLLAALAFVAVSEQIYPPRLVAVLARTYGSPVDPRSAPGSHFRIMPDHAHAGEFVRRSKQEGDVIIAMDWLAQSHYLGHIDFWLRSDAFVPQTYRLRGNYFDIYTGTQVVSNLAELERVITEYAGRRIWIITASPYTEAKLHISSEIMDFLRTRLQHVVFQGRDAKSLVYLFAPPSSRPACAQEQLTQSSGQPCAGTQLH